MQIMGTHFHIPSNDSYIQLTEHIRGVPSFKISGGTEDGCPFTATVAYDDETASYALSHLEVKRAKTSAITGGTLRDIKVSELIQTTMRSAGHKAGKSKLLMRHSFGESLESVEYVPVGTLRHEIQQASLKERPKPTPRVLEMVAGIYEYAQLIGAAPAKAIEHDFNVPARTATHWIKLARERGHLHGPPA